MNLELPADARVQIIISPGSGCAFAEAAQMPMTPVPAMPVASAKSGRALLKGAVVLLLVAGAYTIGLRAGSPLAPLLTHAQANAQEPQQQTAPRPGEVPPSFTQQLQQPPVITPAPGAAPGGPAPAKSAFGLED